MSARPCASGFLEWRAIALALGCVTCLSFDVSDDPSVERTPARYIEEFCHGEFYELEGSAKRTTGLTSDSCGFSVGPGDGTVRFLIPSADPRANFIQLFTVLIADEDGTNGRWEELVAEPHTVGSGYALRATGNKKTRVIDVRVERSLPGTGSGCTIGRLRTGLVKW